MCPALSDPSVNPEMKESVVVRRSRRSNGMPRRGAVERGCFGAVGWGVGSDSGIVVVCSGGNAMVMRCSAQVGGRDGVVRFGDVRFAEGGAEVLAAAIVWAARKGISQAADLILAICDAKLGIRKRPMERVLPR